jgi:abnormal spindle-like microcephaly-associated protein
MSRPSISTPCPAPARQIDLLPSFDDQDDTSQIDYTRVIQREFAHARPSARPRRPAKREIGSRIFEDVAQEGEAHRFEKREEPARRGMLLGKKPTKRVPMGGIGQGRVDTVPANAPREDAGRSQVGEERSKTDAAKREARRRTIYVPSDDTTMMTIHPGANTTHRLDDTFQLPTCQPQSLLDCIAHSPPSSEEARRDVPTKRPRMSLAAAPRRVPLGQMEAKSINAPALDLVGHGGGKENSPPGSSANEKAVAKKIALKPTEPTKAPAARSRLFDTTNASQSKQAVQPRKAVPMPRTKLSPRAPIATNTSKTRPAVTREVLRTTKPNASVERRAKDSSPRVRAPAPPKPWRKSANFVSASDASKAKLQQYQILSEDISQPELYEDSWLDQQEVALTEVINQIFADAEPSTFQTHSNGHSVRESLLAIYDQPHVAMLHKRLQASLCYGALSKPKDVPSFPDLTQDLGLRRRFVQLWMDSYPMETLCAAAEVVVGRKMPMSSSADPTSEIASSPKSMDPKESRRTLIGFLETFFVTVDDVEDARGAREDLSMQRRNKTVLRSLMLTWLLDQAAMSDGPPTRLFKIKSSHKTSVSVLNTLSGMLIPSTGDIVRALRHMDYTLSYIQDPLDEVVYRIDNLAVDLRDGVLLTKLVELLLYHTSSSVWDRLDTTGETITIVLPDATILQSALYAEDGSQQSRVLVQHLKMPCIGHAQKTYNVDIALQALAGHHRTADIVTANISAETIVNGHRENTLNLLWSLVSSIGLDILLDKKALINDIARQSPSSTELETLPIDALLQNWAAVYCLPNAIPITNLTTSFADGSAYSAIVAAFADFFVPTTGLSRPSLGNTTATRLRTMGCSESFTKQLTSTTTSIPTRQTTLANLAFLASRLLPLSKRHHAATTLQRAFRAKQSWIVLKQRVALMRVAAGCAEVVRERQKRVEAVVLVQKRWRAVVQERVERLDRDVIGFQVAARGWMERRKVALAKRGGAAGKRAAGW